VGDQKSTLKIIIINILEIFLRIAVDQLQESLIVVGEKLFFLSHEINNDFVLNINDDFRKISIFKY